ncbi:MAG: hypothetical protein J6X31_06200 [Bacteroidales bacterium]|nr:hypothetical protein [Bacteroidales bacterium]
MTTYIIIGIVIIAIIFLFAKSLKKVNNISEEATMLVAYTKWAGKGKDFLLEREKTQKQFEEDRYKRLMQACFLANRFVFMTKDLNRTYHFTIRENGPEYGETFEVQLAPFIQIIIQTLNRITESLPQSYQSQVDDYMRNPLSRQNEEKSKEIENDIFPKSKRVRKYADPLRKSIIDSDYLYVLCR